MKMRIVSTPILLIGMFFLLSAIPAMAQIENKVMFDAPFPFYAGNAKMPAGSYTVTQPDDNAGLLSIESADGSHSALVDYVAVDSDPPPSKSEVTFNRYGKGEFLTRISVQGQSLMQILPTRAEQNAAKAAKAEKHGLAANTGK